MNFFEAIKQTINKNRSIRIEKDFFDNVMFEITGINKGTGIKYKHAFIITEETMNERHVSMCLEQSNQIIDQNT